MTSVDIIQLLTGVVLAGTTWFLKEVWVEVKTMRKELTVIQTEHKMMMDCKGGPHGNQE